MKSLLLRGYMYLDPQPWSVMARHLPTGSLMAMEWIRVLLHMHTSELVSPGSPLLSSV